MRSVLAVAARPIVDLLRWVFGFTRDPSQGGVLIDAGSMGASWWAAPGVASIVGGLVALARGTVGAGLILVVVGVSLVRSGVVRYRRHGRL